MAEREKLILEGDSRGMTDAIKRGEDSFDRFQKSVRTAVTTGGLAIAGRKIFEIGASFVNAASDANEAASAFNTTFGPAVADLSDELGDFATMAGLSTGQMQQLLSVTGNFTVGLGATQDEAAELSSRVVRLAADVNSLRNVEGGTTRVINALNSALAGETEALKQVIGPISAAEITTRALAETGKDTADELTRLERANATLALSYERAGVAVGDLERTQDSFANQSRALQAELQNMREEVGAELLPALQGMLPTIRDMIPALKDAALAGVALFEAAEPLVALFGRNLPEAIRGSIFLVQLFASPFSNAAANAKDLSVAIQAVGDQMDDGISGIDAYINGIIFLQDRGALTNEALEKLQAATGATAAEAFAAAEIIRNMGDETGLTEGQIRALEDALTFGLTKEMTRFTEKTRVSGRRLREVGEETRTVNLSFRDAEERTLNWRMEMDDLAEALDTARRRQESLSDVLMAAADPVFAAVDAMGNYKQLLEDVNEDGKVTAEEQLAIAESLLTVQSRLDALSGGAADEGIVAIATALGVTVEEVKTLLEQLGILDGLEVTAVVNVEGSEAGNIVDSFTRRRRAADAGAFARGGVIPGSPGEPVRATLHGGEIVVPADGAGALPFNLQRALSAQLGGGQGGAAGGTTVVIENAVFELDVEGFDLTQPTEVRRMVRAIGDAVTRTQNEGPRRPSGAGIG